MVQRQRGCIVDRVHLTTGQQITIIGIDGNINIASNIGKIGMRCRQWIAGRWIEHRWAGWRAFAALAEHQRIRFLAGTQRRDLEVIDAQLAQLQITLEMGI